MPNSIRFLAGVMLLAAVYYVTGRLGLLLSIPPGFATAVWPPSGIALAAILLFGYRYWPGVLLGSFMINVFIAFDVTSSEAIIKSSLIAGTIAAGAALQALGSAVLVRRYVRFPTALESIRDIFILLLLGGLAGCVINASISTSMLHIVGIIPLSSLGISWFTWWVGDSIGVIAFTPVLVLIFSRGLNISNLRKLTVGVSSLLVFFLAVYFYHQSREHDAAQDQIVFGERAGEIVQVFRRDLDSYLNLLVAIERFFISSDYVSYEEFIRFTDGLFDLHPGIHSLSWNPRVKHEDRDQFIQSIQEQGYTDFVIKDRLTHGKIDIAPVRQEYFPVAYVAPFAENRAAHGYDTYGPDPVSENRRMSVLNRARDTGYPGNTGRISLVQAEDTYGLLVYHPVYSVFASTDTVEQRRRALLGFAAGVFIIPDMLKAIKTMAARSNMDVVLRDTDSKSHDNVLFDSRTADYKASDEAIEPAPGSLTYRQEFDFAGRQWAMELFGKVPDLAAGYNWYLWTVLVGGLLFTGLFSAFLLALTARTDIVQQLVEEKTHTLLEIQHHLQEANQELEEFAYRTSHDLHAPLVSALGLLKVAINSISSRDYNTMMMSLSHTQESLNKLKVLIEDIITLTVIKKLDEDIEHVDFKGMLDESLQKLSHMENFERLEICIDHRFEGKLHVKRMRLGMIVENLLSNSIKYQDLQKTNSRVHISTWNEGDCFVMQVTDNGIGIPEEQRDKLFTMFSRFHPRAAYGSGLGLYILKKSADVLNATVSYQGLDDGSSFQLRVPLG